MDKNVILIAKLNSASKSELGKYVLKSLTLILTEIRPLIVCYDIDMLLLCS
jgi:hypothetical protein